MRMGWLTAACLVVGMAGCGGGDSHERVCRTAAECAAAEVCVAARCVAETACTTSRMCPGLVCDVEAGRCVECNADGDCGGGMICDRHSCVAAAPPCDSDRDCSERGLVCDVASGRCVECNGDADCDASMMVCADHRCTVPCLCTTDADCADGLVCNGAEVCGECAEGCVALAAPCGPTQMCEEGGDECVTVCEVERDGDGDGADAMACGGMDCDDANAGVFPGATELCNRRDDDCSAGGGVASDEDGDRDGYAPVDAGCTGGDFPALDCDDGDALRNPDRAEICDGVDNDCSGTVDDGEASAACTEGSCVAGTCTTARYLQVASGVGHSCALRVDGHVVCWGRGTGVGIGGDVLVPVEVAGVIDAVQIAAGEDVTCALRAGGTVTCWGRCGKTGQLGCATIDTPVGPGMVAGVAGATDLGVGNFHSCAVVEGGRVRCWGENRMRGSLGDGTVVAREGSVEVIGVTGAVEVAVGQYGHTCARLSTGRAMCWGQGLYGAIGDGTLTDPQPTPQLVSGLLDATDLAAGNQYTCASRAGGRPVCWGTNDYGNFADGTTIGRTTPTEATTIPADAQMARGFAGLTTCVTIASGALQCVGNNTLGELGIGGAGGMSLTLVTVPGIVNALDVVGTEGHYCAAAPGGVYCWGDGRNGGLGNGSTMPEYTPR